MRAQDQTLQRCWNNPHAWLLAFCGGVVSLRFLERLPSSSVAATAVAACLVLLLLGMGCQWLRPAAAFVLGFCWANAVATAVLDATIPLALEKKDVIISGQVIGVVTASSGFQRFDFAVDSLHWQGLAYPSPGNIRLKLYHHQPPIRSGQQWRFTARLKQSRGHQNPAAEFNFETHLFHHRLRATGYVRAAPMPVLLAPPQPYSITAFRERGADFITTSLTTTSQGGRAGLVTALAVGVRNRMRPADWEVLVRTGTIHLVAISGLHIGLVSALTLLAGACIWRRVGALSLWLPAPKAGVIVGLLAGWVYAFLAGMTIPTQRAVCMLTVVAAALFFQRRPFGGENLIMALAVVLAVDPLAPLAGGFWLSFGAVMILLLAAARTRQSALSRPAPNRLTLGNGPLAENLLRRLGRMLSAWSTVQAVLFIGMAPLLLALFQRVSLVAPLANLIAIPVVGMVAVPLTLVGLLLYALGLEQAAALAFTTALWMIDALWVLLQALSDADWSVWQQAAPPLWTLPLAAVGVLLALSRRAFPARWTGLLWLLPMFAVAPTSLAPGEYHYTVLDVGQGLASVVRTRNHLLVYDAGPRYASGFDAGKLIVAPYLRQLGVAAIDTLVISHGDNDHLGGTHALRDEFTTARVLTSVPTLLPGATPCRAGQNWRWDGVWFDMLAPPAAGSGAYTGNEASCVLKISSPFGVTLLTGDIGKQAETALVESGIDFQADVLQAPHHGSKTSSSEAFLSRARPAVALNSMGYLNRYHHPHKSVAERYARLQIPFYNTADEGAITASFSATGITLQGQRGARRQYWLQPAKHLGEVIRIKPRRRGELRQRNGGMGGW